MSDQDIIDTIADDFNTEIVGNSIDYNRRAAGTTQRPLATVLGSGASCTQHPST